jgi:hypothetical protein
MPVGTRHDIACARGELSDRAPAEQPSDGIVTKFAAVNGQGVDHHDVHRQEDDSPSRRGLDEHHGHQGVDPGEQDADGTSSHVSGQNADAAREQTV